MSLVPSSADSPVIKIGAVVVRVAPHAHEFLILQPIPKNPGEVPHFVLPRGSRQYRDAAGAWVDARDVATAEAHRDALEPFSRGLAREIEEEAGIGAAMLARCSVSELGVMPFQSRSKGVYPIYWFVVTVAASDAQALAEATPVDALAVRWASLDVIRVMAAAGTFSAGYVPVIEAALAMFTRADGAA